MVLARSMSWWWFHLHGLTWPVGSANRKLQNEKFLTTVGFEPGTFLLRSDRAKRRAIRWDIYGALKCLPRFTWVCYLPLPNVTWHSGTWPYTMTHSIDQALHQFANLLPNWTLLPILTLLPNFGGFHGALQRVRLASRGRLLLRTPGPVPFGTCICSDVETILSWTCHFYEPFESQTSLGTSILLLKSTCTVYHVVHVVKCKLMQDTVNIYM